MYDNNNNNNNKNNKNNNNNNNNNDNIELLFKYSLDPNNKNCCNVKNQLTIYNILHSIPIEFDNYFVLGKKNDCSALNQLRYKNIADAKEDRAIGSLVGLVIGDALGAPLEFMPVRYNTITRKDFDHVENLHSLKPGQWTDDASMALCLCDSLLALQRFDPIDNMLRYLNWWYNGYNNAFIYDVNRKDKHSIGLGGNISLAFKRFLQFGEAYTHAGDKKTSGNGSLMRLAPIAIAYCNDANKAISMAKKSSYVTHKGKEAAECCALLSFLLVNGINTGNKEICNRLSDYFTSTENSVNHLAASLMERTIDGRGLDVDRNWNWKDANYRYSPARTKNNQYYIGSYAMDALSMALHCFYTTKDFSSCVTKAINMCGDADTVGSIAGQIAGAYYGASQIPYKWIQTIQKWDNGGTIIYRASKLYKSFCGRVDI